VYRSAPHLIRDKRRMRSRHTQNPLRELPPSLQSAVDEAPRSAIQRTAIARNWAGCVCEATDLGRHREAESQLEGCRGTKRSNHSGTSPVAPIAAVCSISIPGSLTNWRSAAGNVGAHTMMLVHGGSERNHDAAAHPASSNALVRKRAEHLGCLSSPSDSSSLMAAVTFPVLDFCPAPWSEGRAPPSCRSELGQPPRIQAPCPQPFVGSPFRQASRL
jgi:hypothetical protein